MFQFSTPSCDNHCAVQVSCTVTSMIMLNHLLICIPCTWNQIGVTRSYSSHPFLCALVISIMTSHLLICIPCTWNQMHVDCKSYGNKGTSTAKVTWYDLGIRPLVAHYSKYSSTTKKKVQLLDLCDHNSYKNSTKCNEGEKWDDRHCFREGAGL